MNKVYKTYFILLVFFRCPIQSIQAKVVRYGYYRRVVNTDSVGISPPNGEHVLVHLAFPVGENVSEMC